MKVPPSLITQAAQSPQPSQTDLLMAAALMREQDPAGATSSPMSRQGAPQGAKMAGDVVPMNLRSKGYNDYMQGTMDPPGTDVGGHYAQGRLDAARDKLKSIKTKRINPEGDD